MAAKGNTRSQGSTQGCTKLSNDMQTAITARIRDTKESRTPTNRNVSREVVALKCPRIADLTTGLYLIIAIATYLV
jgi:hypothetical protein